MRAHFIFFVSDQDRSTEFYRTVLAVDPTLHVPGMSEFSLPGGSILGLMPISGISRLLSDTVPGIANQPAVPRAELYLVVNETEPYVLRALAAGAREVSPVQARDWGDTAGYYQDPDGHVIAFATSHRSANPGA